MMTEGMSHGEAKRGTGSGTGRRPHAKVPDPVPGPGAAFARFEVPAENLCWDEFVAKYGMGSLRFRCPRA